MKRKLFKKLIYLVMTVSGVTFLIYFSFFVLKQGEKPGVISIISGYFQWWMKLFELDFGMSLKDHRPVLEKILERLPATLELNVLSLIFSFLTAIPLTVLTVKHKNGFIEKSVSFIAMLLFSIPAFWIALVFSIFFGYQIGEISSRFLGYSYRLPISGMRSLEMVLNPGAYSLTEVLLDRVAHLILPVICSSMFNIALIYKFFSIEFAGIMNREYIIFARSRGIPEWKIIIREAGKNAIFPVITVFSLLIPGLLSSNFVIETIFSWPGIGRLGYDAILSRDYPLVMALAMITTLIVTGTNMFIDTVYLIFNPLLRESGGK